MNRFNHLKKKPLSMGEFIESAEVEQESAKALLKTKKEDILLSVSGKINREKDCGKPSLVYLKKEIELGMKKYCHGNKTLTINYLIGRGLDSLIEEKKLVLHMED